MLPTGEPSSRRTLDNDEIRVLIYDEEQSESSGLLACQTRIQRLSHVNAGVATPYAALSYVWGDAAITKPLICDGVEVKVTVNLQYALSVIWNAYPEICLWADALSITQDNLPERNHQVSFMGDIFRSANRVLVSLGPPLTGDNRFWEFLQSFTRHNYKIAPRKYRDDWIRLKKGLPNRLTSGMDDLIERDWFRRAWTYQEIRLAVAAEVSCGDYFMPWNSFVKSIGSLRKFREILARDRPLGRLHNFIKSQERAFMLKQSSEVQTPELGTPNIFYLQPDSRKHNLLELLVEGWPRDASDARDKIYAFTSSLLASTSYVELRPDYTLDTRSTFIRLIRVLINNENKLNFLKYARGVGEPIQPPDGDISDNLEGIPLKAQRLIEGNTGSIKDKDGPEEPLEADDLPSWACDWRRQSRPDSSFGARSEGYFDVRQNAIPLRQSVYDFDKRLVLKGTALGRVLYQQTDSVKWSREPHTFSRLPRCALQKASSLNATPISQQYEMFDHDIQSGKRDLTGSNMVLLLLQTLLHDRSGCDCPEQLEQDLLAAWAPHTSTLKSCAGDLDWLFILDGLDYPVLLRPHIMPGRAESSRSEIGFDFVSVWTLYVRKERRKWKESPFAYGEVVIF